MSNQSVLALLGLLAVAGYQNRDKISEMLRGATPGGAAAPGQPGLGQEDRMPGGAGEDGGLGGLGGILGNLGGGSSGGLGGLLGGLTGGGAGSLISGGLGQLMNHLQQNGLGQQASSWVGTGPNEPVSGHEIGQAIGPDILEQLSAKTGLSREEIQERLSKVLPEAVDGMTPNGQLPQGT